MQKPAKKNAKNQLKISKMQKPAKNSKKSTKNQQKCKKQRGISVYSISRPTNGIGLSHTTVGLIKI